ncbi:ATP-binding protein [Nocardioides sp. SR21]|uniref:ATP-binding protein n=1 Tax=Nocardioides sp. SR21 TaxID=2919501 RepID=UPI001FAA7EDF|nr:ATP-binding protein [Nocardioides sp. SR21]
MSRSETLDPAALSAHTARSIVGDVCASADMPADTTDTALLLVSEVVTNAVNHGRGRPVLDVQVAPDRLSVSVSDSAPGAPEVRRDNPLLADGGRGMLLVETLASRWGIDRRPGGKRVWFELDRS